MKTKPLISGAVALAMACGVACTTRETAFHPSRLGDVDLGMPKDDVILALGWPSAAATVIDMDFVNGTHQRRVREVLRYTHISGSTNESNHFVVFLQEGKVESYGPEVGHLRGQLDGVFMDVPMDDLN